MHRSKPVFTGGLQGVANDFTFDFDHACIVPLAPTPVVHNHLMAGNRNIQVETEHRPIDRILRPFQRFADQESSSAQVLLGCAVLAMILMNSPLSGGFQNILSQPVGFKLGSLEVIKPLQIMINDGLMALFFFVIGLEIKREILVGELASVQKAAMPMLAAVGGMVVPAAIFLALNVGTPGKPGWGIPMATDIAFALGILALAGPRVPASAKVFLAALAIVDDIGAVIVIAIFYTASIQAGLLLAAAGVVLVLIGMNAMGIRRPIAYGLVGFVLWLLVLKSGVHATIAGVTLAMTIPASARLDVNLFRTRMQKQLEAFSDPGIGDETPLLTEEQDVILRTMESDLEMVGTPLQTLMTSFHTLSAWLIMPLFALANAGLDLRTMDLASSFSGSVSIGVMLGLTLGKPIGILLFCFIGLKLGWAKMPKGLRWSHLVPVAILAGVGFTMSLFIGGLAFDPGTVQYQQAKLGVLCASLASGAIGYALLKRSVQKRLA